MLKNDSLDAIHRQERTVVRFEVSYFDATGAPLAAAERAERLAPAEAVRFAASLADAYHLPKVARRLERSRYRAPCTLQALPGGGGGQTIDLSLSLENGTHFEFRAIQKRTTDEVIQL